MIDKSKWITYFLLTSCFFVTEVSVSVTSVVYVLAFLAVLFTGHWREKYHRVLNNQGALSFLLLFILYIIGMTYTTSTTHLMLHDLSKNHWLLMTPFFIAFITEEKWRERMMTVFLSVMVITLVLSYLKYFFHVSWIEGIDFHRHSESADVFQDHIIQSFSMSIAAFICGYRVLFKKELSSIMRLFYAFIFILMILNVVCMSHGRTGYASILLLIGYLSWIRFGWQGIFLGAMICMLLVGSAFLLSSGFQERTKAAYLHYESYGHTQHVTSIGQRLEMYHIAEKMIKARPWFGYGTGGIRTALPAVVPANERIFNPSIDYVESIYLNYLLQFGVFGFSVLLIALGMQIRTSFLLAAPYRHLMQAVFILVFVGGLFNGYFVSFTIAHYYALFSALCFSVLPMSKTA